MKKSLTVLVLLAVSSAASLVLPTVSNAAQVLTIEVSASAVSSGEVVRITGSGTAPRSVVRLQRLTRDGWSPALSTRTTARRTFVFETAPPRGVQQYRVVQPGTEGRPRLVSAPVAISVHWRPDVVVTDRAVHDELGRSVLEIVGTTDPAVDELLLKRRETRRAPWVTVETMPVTDGTAQTTVRDVLTAQFRLVARASGLLLRSVSRVVANQHAPYELQLEEPLVLPGLFIEDNAATVKILLHDELPVTLLGTGEDATAWNATVRGPGGRVVGSFSHDAGERLLRMESPRSGWHTIEVEQLAGEEWTMWAFANPVVEASIDGSPVPFEKTDWYPPFVYGLFQGTAGQVVTVLEDRPWWSDAAVLTADGTPVIGQLQLHTFRLPDDGDYLAQMVPEGDTGALQVLEAATAVLPTDGSPGTFTIDRRWRSVIAEVQGTPGEHVRVCRDAVQPIDAVSGVLVYDQEREFLGRDDCRSRCLKTVTTGSRWSWTNPAQSP